MFDFQTAVSFINNLHVKGSDFTLKPIKRLLKVMGNPQDEIKIIHLAGTNGKGSVSTYLSKVLSQKYKVGVFNSPAVFNYTEIIKINDENISTTAFAKYFNEIYPCLYYMEQIGLGLTSFMVEVALFYYVMAKEKVDVAIVECGLGGTLDATNVEKTNLLSVITTVDYDHTTILGNTLEEIAENKLGVVRNDTTIITTVKNKNIQAFTRVAKEKNCNLIFAKVANGKTQGLEREIEYNGKYATKMIGSYQDVNLPIALETLGVLSTLGYDLPVNTIKKGIEEAKINGRFEVLETSPPIILDGAHNPNAATFLSKFIKNNRTKYDLRLVVGIFKDKDYENVINKTVPYANSVVTFDWDNKRSLGGKDLLNVVKKYNPNVCYAPTPLDALTLATTNAKENTLIIIFGSLSHLNEFKKIAGGKYDR